MVEIGIKTAGKNCGKVIGRCLREFKVKNVE